MNKTYVFKSERKWNKVYDALDEIVGCFCSYGYKAITVFDTETDNYLREYCKAHRVAYTED